MTEIKIEHVAIATNSEEESDKFFVDLLGCKKTRSFTVEKEKMNDFFHIPQDHVVLRYEKETTSFEVFVSNENSKAQDQFTHTCLLISNRDEFLQKAKLMDFITIQVPRADSDSYYLFIKDGFGNLYEIKDL